MIQRAPDVGIVIAAFNAADTIGRATLTLVGTRLAGDGGLLDADGAAFVIHANHANEFDVHVDAALERLCQAGAQLLNQAVLLRGVNDSVEALAALSERSFAAGVLPYYLHQLDRVAGVAHFEVADEQALALHAELRARLSGYLVPRLVREVAGDPGKRPL